jgi:hypothetical protein
MGCISSNQNFQIEQLLSSCGNYLNGEINLTGGKILFIDFVIFIYNFIFIINRKLRYLIFIYLFLFSITIYHYFNFNIILFIIFQTK